MDSKQKRDLADTYVFDEDVMEEMENVEATLEIPNAWDELAETLTEENTFLEDVETSPVVLNDGSSKQS
jgi:hypothetical protein